MVKERRVMSATRRSCLALLLVSAGACGAPTAPSSSETATRITALKGSLAFGNVRLGSQATTTLTITNSGNSPLTITGMTDSSVFKASWTSGTIAPGGSQQVTIRFAPTLEQAFAETLTVNGDYTSGTNTMAMSGTGFEIAPGSYNFVFDPG